MATLGIVMSLFSCDQDHDLTLNEESTVNTSARKVESSYFNYMVLSSSENQVSNEILEAIEKNEGEITRDMNEIGMVTIKTTNADFQKELKKVKGVRSVITDLTVNWIEKPGKNQVSAESIGDDETYYPYQWGVRAIQAPEAWEAGYTGQGVRVFVLDSGIDSDHIEFQGILNKDLSTSFVAGEEYDYTGPSFANHGTHTAGTIAAADNGVGVIGVAPNVELVAVKVLSADTGRGSTSGINAGIIYAADNGADVINMSLGSSINKNGWLEDEEGNEFKIPASEVQEYIHAQQRAVNYAIEKGVTIIGSAGNDGTNHDGDGSRIKTPAGLNGVISVSATAPNGWFYGSTDYDAFASYSSYGRSHVTVAAPGGDFDYPGSAYVYDMILSTGAGTYYFSAGTSMAAPHVSGIAALIIEKNGGEMNPQEVKKKLIQTADHVDGNGTSLYYGKGRVNAFRAVTE